MKTQTKQGFRERVLVYGLLSSAAVILFGIAMGSGLFIAVGLLAAFLHCSSIN